MSDDLYFVGLRQLYIFPIPVSRKTPVEGTRACNKPKSCAGEMLMLSDKNVHKIYSYWLWRSHD